MQLDQIENPIILDLSGKCAIFYGGSFSCLKDKSSKNLNQIVFQCCKRCMLRCSGREKGKVGEITQIFKHNSTVIVKNLNLKIKHVKGREEGEQGQIIKEEGPIHSSNVMLYSIEKEVPSRVGHKILVDGTCVPFLIKTGQVIDSKEKLETES